MKNEGGFSYLELLLVVAILLVLGRLTTGFYARFLTQSSVSSVQDQLVGQFRKAQIYSMMGKQNSSWGVKFAANKITLFKTGSAVFDENFSVSTSITVSGFTSVTFAKNTGLPDATPTITISGNNQTKNITVNSQGVVTR